MSLSVKRGLPPEQSWRVFWHILIMGLKDFDWAILNPLVLTPGLTLTGDGVIEMMIFL